MAGRITLLGTGTCQIQLDSMASSVLLELDEQRVVFDLGRGVTQRLTQRGLHNDDIEHVVLSHFHPDHVADLIPFLHAGCWSQIDPRTRDLNVYGPIGVRVQVMRILSLFGPDELTRPHFDVHIHEVRTDRFSIGEQGFEFIDLPPANNHGLRFSFAGGTYALTGDSMFHDNLVGFLRGVDLAVIDSGHLTDEQIVELAARSQARRIICSHLYRELNAASLHDAARARGYTGRLVVGQDLMSFEI